MTRTFIPIHAFNTNIPPYHQMSCHSKIVWLKRYIPNNTSAVSCMDWRMLRGSSMSHTSPSSLRELYLIFNSKIMKISLCWGGSSTIYQSEIPIPPVKCRNYPLREIPMLTIACLLTTEIRYLHLLFMKTILKLHKKQTKQLWFHAVYSHTRKHII